MGLVLAAACTAPPRPQPDAGPPPPPPRVHITVAAPGLSAADVEAQAVAPLEQALAPLPEVQALVSRTDEGHAELTATVTTPAAIEAIRAAMQVGQTRLPPSAEPPVIHRDTPELPALLLTFEDEQGAIPSIVGELARVPGVARVDVCGGAEPALTITLDHRRLGDLGVDTVVQAVRVALSETRLGLRAAPDLADILAIALPGDRYLRDIAALQTTGTPRPCKNLLDAGDVVLAVVPQAGADPARVAADVRANLGGVPPSRDGFIPPDGDLPPAVLDLELAPTPEAPQAVETCLRDLPAVTGLALVRPDRAPPPAALPPPAPPEPAAPVHARLYISARPELAAASKTTPPPAPTFPIAPVREALSHCPGVRRHAVLAPLAVADHPLTVELLGPDLPALARLADRAAALLQGLPGVTLVRVHAPRERPARELTISPYARALFAPSGLPSTISEVTRLAVGPLELDELAGRSVRLDLFDRPGSLDQVLPLLTFARPEGPIALSDFVRLDVAPSTLAPRYRVDQRTVALVELRLRRAADREAVERLLAADLELPPGLQLRLGPALALRSP